MIREIKREDKPLEVMERTVLITALSYGDPSATAALKEGQYKNKK